jgi:non-heme chloroperoxidase
LLHGSSAHGEYLHPLAERLRNIGKVYVPNLRGHYASGSVRGDCSYIGQLEDDFADLINHFSLRDKEIYVVGHSSGGGLAIRLAGGPYGNWIRRFVLLSPAIPTAPTMRQGNAGGWAKLSLWKIIPLAILNFFRIRFLNHSKVIQFNRPVEYCNGTETLSYSFNLNSSYHPRLPYHHDIAALKHRSLVIVGSEDEANDPMEYQKVMQNPQSASIQIIQGVKHLDIVRNLTVSDTITSWVQNE